MPTHGIGKGTCNLPVNLIHDERSVLVKLAIQQDISLGAVVRAFIHEGIRRADPAAASRLVDLRRQRRAEFLKT